MSNWNSVRETGIKTLKEERANIIQNWLNDIGYKEPVGYEINDKTIKFFARMPGLLIGPAGRDIKKFKDMWSKEFYGDWKIEFVEVSNGFVNV